MRWSGYFIIIDKLILSTIFHQKNIKDYPVTFDEMTGGIYSISISRNVIMQVPNQVTPYKILKKKKINNFP